ncbi:MAG TPA: protoheme IX farnesyltransferase, partial [Geobacteraceae bacterium]|nr:protoheme IX farnesyltransferase [Geobacteraceae bacterium]
LLAGYAGMVTAARGFPEPRTAAVCLASLLLSATGAAMLNCILDRPLDRNMERLRERVRALDAIGTARLLFVALACIAAALSLALTLNLLAFLLVLSAVVLYTLVYTLVLKRRFAWGAVPGGIPGALPVLIGQAAVAGTVDTAGLILFTVIFLWQPPHFWVLALRHGNDYRAAGLPVLPVACGERYTRGMILLFTSALLPATLALSLTGRCPSLFAAAAVALWLWFLTACIRHAVMASRYERAFRASVIYLTVLLLAVILDSVILR